ncbi:MAG TPA: hypothetical protein VGF30_02845, partial [Bacteroidia bacterium]
MKKILIMLTIALSFNAAFAQETNKKAQPKGKGKQPVEARAQRAVDNLDKTVTLTPEQKTKVYDLSLARAKKHNEIREKYKGQPEKKEEAKAEMKANQKEYRAAVKLLLTEEQLTTLKEKHKAKQEKRA